MFALVSYPDGTPIVLAGPCWPFCVGVTLPLILVVCGLVSYFLVIDGDFGLVRIMCLVYLLVCSYRSTALFSSKFVDSLLTSLLF
jgi:hypothetical protein